MILKSVKLSNIRTYENEMVNFTEGSTLLSGDIGSGKSSVLLCIEFGLFGLQRGEIAGSDLLRHGANEGSVELCFQENGSYIVIGRCLKRTKKGITQESGFIEVNGKREEKSPSDLRALVLELLGYPNEYVNKNPIMFRYTVYTAQDDMKKILFSDADERLQIIRKIFDIDKYGRIRANANEIILKELRSVKRECQAKFSDLDLKMKEKQEKESHRITSLELLSKKKIEFYESEIALDFLEKEFEIVAEQIKKQSTVKEQYSKNNAILDQKKTRRSSIDTEFNSYKKRIDEIKKLLKSSIEIPEFDEKNLADKQRNLEQEKSKLTSNIGFLESELRRLQTVLTKGLCDFCSQTVANPENFKGKVDEKQIQMKDSKIRIDAINLELKIIDQSKQSIIKYKSELILKNEREKTLQDCVNRLNSLENETKILENDIESLRLLVKKLGDEITNEFDKKYRELKIDIVSNRTVKENLSKDVVRIEQQILNIERDIENLIKQIGEKEQLKIKFEKLGEVITWFEIIFIPLTETIEKHVLSTIQSEFNQFFQQWFEVLIPNQSISVSVDDSFSPIIEQGGYETEYQNLSGGEKTSVALAYRLALNKVINSMVEGIKTKDLIILDEPTDGFSTDQLDRLRDVINDLGLRQMLIVSHEPKIDTYVDNVIRFYKEGNVSRVVR
ncbi:MAG: AAA family ATPase [Candidatus Aenigmarchaeota archaeon]|nr:AAA family ATPase [Candidatus Aenigmarchaeota archaeon]